MPKQVMIHLIFQFIILIFIGFASTPESIYTKHRDSNNNLTSKTEE